MSDKAHGPDWRSGKATWPPEPAASVPVLEDEQEWGVYLADSVDFPADMFVDGNEAKRAHEFMRTLLDRLTALRAEMRIWQIEQHKDLQGEVARLTAKVVRLTEENHRKAAQLWGDADMQDKIAAEADARGAHSTRDRATGQAIGLRAAAGLLVNKP